MEFLRYKYGGLPFILKRMIPITHLLPLHAQPISLYAQTAGLEVLEPFYYQDGNRTRRSRTAPYVILSSAFLYESTIVGEYRTNELIYILQIDSTGKIRFLTCQLENVEELFAMPVHRIASLSRISILFNHLSSRLGPLQRNQD